MAETASHINFYENIAEVRIRLVRTVIKYDDKPYYVLTASDHMKDGIIRLYLDDLTTEYGPAHLRIGVPHSEYGPSAAGKVMDAWLEKEGKDETVIRKMMNSPKFNRFRPFPLGMCNYSGNVFYVERSPLRETHQGLTQKAITCNAVSLTEKKRSLVGSPQLLSRELTDTILGAYPAATEVIDALLNPRTKNEGAAFDREFAFVKGPMSSIYLAYKSDIVGILPSADTTVVKLGAEHKHLREVVQSLRLFQTVE